MLSDMLIAFFSSVGIIVIIRFIYGLLLTPAHEDCPVVTVIRVDGEQPGLERMVRRARHFSSGGVVIVDAGMDEDTRRCAGALRNCGAAEIRKDSDMFRSIAGG